EYHVMEGDTLQLIAGNMVTDDFDVLYETPVNAADGNWHTMKIDISGTAPTINITIWWDGVQKHTEQVNDVAEDEAYAHIGFFSYGNNVDMWFDDVSMTYTSITTDIEEFSNIIPADFTLFQNYPNPFNPTTTLQYELPDPSDVNMTIYNVVGRKIKEWNITNQNAGMHELVWDGTNSSGNMVSTGVYIYSLQAGDFVDTKKMVFMK
ncbi:MAG: T9SS type A sorting domain-containing protein, partial [Candidatus Marinimicrobia bacterium]|nr:T9SS type A sorting domain-containing protein [Candidatus Neomarinimicrobiota bacterium]